MRLSIHTIESTLFDRDVTSVTLPTETGEITILERHMPLISLVKPGRIKIVEPRGREEVIQFESTGFLEVEPEGRGVTILAEQHDQ